MGTAVEQAQCELPLVRPSTLGGFTWINLLERWLRPDMLTTAEAALVDELKRAARVLGAPLLDAESRDDLNDKIERVILRPEFQRRRGVAVAGPPVSTPRPTIAEFFAQSLASRMPSLKA